MIFALATKSNFSFSLNLPNAEEPKLRSKGILPEPVIEPSLVTDIACLTLKIFPSYSPLLLKFPRLTRSNDALTILISYLNCVESKVPLKFKLPVPLPDILKNFGINL